MRKPKKCETLEIRLPYESKQAFMQRCRDEGRSASDALRELIDGYVQLPTTPRSCGAFRWLAACLSALAVGATAAPTLACPLQRQLAEHFEIVRLTQEQSANRSRSFEERAPGPDEQSGP